MAIDAVKNSRSSRQVPVVLPAATVSNGQIIPSEIPVMQSGTFFYVLSCSSPLTIQPVRAGAVGASNVFGIAQGQPVENGFDTLTISNPNPFPVVGLVWVGFDSFINNQLILANNIISQVANPVYSLVNSSASVAINDLTGSTFTDINGGKWGALNRVAILVFNADSGVTLLLQGKGAATAGGNSVGIIYPLTPIRFDISGDYALSNGGGNINAIVSEIYQAIPL